MWNRNCIAIGLSGGFLEPLESTSIWLIQAAIALLMQRFPDRGFDDVDIEDYNRKMARRFEEVRDFLILHYKANERTDSEFWKECANMPIPDSLATRMELFRRRGHVIFHPAELFVEANWLAVYLGQHILPETCDPRVDCIQEQQLRNNLRQIHMMVGRAANEMPPHATTIERFCRSDPEHA